MLNKEVTLSATVSNNGYSLTVGPDTPEVILVGLLRKGFQATIGDAVSTAKGDKSEDANGKVEYATATPEQRKAAGMKRLEALQKGDYVFGGRMGSMSNEDKALKAVLKSKGVKFTKGVTVADALEAFTKELAKTKEKAFEPDMVEKVKGQMETTDLYTKTLEALKAGSQAAPTDDIEI